MNNKFAVLVGINKFADPSAELRGCVNDTLNLRGLLIQKGWKPENIRLLCDQRATRQAIYWRWDWAVSQAKPGDTVFLGFSGHGTQVTDRDGDELNDCMDECLTSYDFPSLWDGGVGPGEDESFYKTLLGRAPRPLICDDDLAIFLKRFQAGVRVILLVDACHSGSCDRNINPHYRKARSILPPADIAARAMDRDIPTRKFGMMKVAMCGSQPDIHYIEQNHVLLSGCRDNQTSADADIGGMPQGAMTWSFLTCLKQLSEDANWIAVHEQMLITLKGQGYDQVPQLTGPTSLLEEPVFRQETL